MLLSQETEQNNAFAATWVQLEITILSEVHYHTKGSKSEKTDKYHMVSLICGIIF